MCEESPLVSIIIPVYNVEPYLREALESVRVQTYRNFEAIVVDDGSTDASGAICDEYAVRDPRFRVVHQANGGLSAARNAGLDVMRGRLVAYLDPDDALAATFVERLVDALVREGADIVTCRYTSHRTRGTLRQSERDRKSPSMPTGTYGRVEALRALAEGTLNVSVWNKLYRRELWADLRFPVGHVYEDLDSTVLAFDRSDTSIMIDDVLYLHRSQRPGSITSTLSVENVRDERLARAHFDAFVASRTPEVFDEGLLRRREGARLKDVIASYVRLQGLSGDGAHELSEELRAEAVETVGKVGVSSLTLRTRVAYRMMVSCPWLLPVAYRAYRPLRALVSKVVGR